MMRVGRRAANKRAFCWDAQINHEARKEIPNSPYTGKVVGILRSCRWLWSLDTPWMRWAEQVGALVLFGFDANAQGETVPYNFIATALMHMRPRGG